MIEVFPKRIVGAFPDGQYVVILENADGRLVAMVCNAPYDKMIYSSNKMCSGEGLLSASPPSGIIKEFRIVDREGVMSFAAVGLKSANEYT